MKKTTLAFLLIIFPMFAAPLNADIYKYIDENGQKRWTDDLSQVPPEQRNAVQRLVTEDDTPAVPDQVGDDDIQSDASGQTDAENKEPSLDREALSREKADLEALYKELVAEKEQLETAKSEAASPEAQEELKQRINAYNEKAKTYDQRLDSFNQKASLYNERIRAAQKNE